MGGSQRDSDTGGGEAVREKPTVFNYQNYEEAVAENKRLRDRLANEQIRTRITVADILEEVKAEICEQYCKYPDLYKRDWHKDMTEDEFIEKICGECPLHRL